MLRALEGARGGRLLSIEDYQDFDPHDQDGLPSCWRNGSAHGFTTQHHIVGGPVKMISANSLCPDISFHVGGDEWNSAQSLITDGGATQDVVANNETNGAAFRTQAVVESRKHGHVFQLYRFSGSQAQRQLQMMTAMCLEMPMCGPIAYDWWSHVISACAGSGSLGRARPAPSSIGSGTTGANGARKTNSAAGAMWTWPKATARPIAAACSGRLWLLLRRSSCAGTMMDPKLLGWFTAIGLMVYAAIPSAPVATKPTDADADVAAIVELIRPDVNVAETSRLLIENQRLAAEVVRLEGECRSAIAYATQCERRMGDMMKGRR
jgi:hypothetical protein